MIIIMHMHAKLFVGIRSNAVNNILPSFLDFILPSEYSGRSGT